MKTSRQPKVWIGREQWQVIAVNFVGTRSQAMFYLPWLGEFMRTDLMPGEILRTFGDSNLWIYSRGSKGCIVLST